MRVALLICAMAALALPCSSGGAIAPFPRELVRKMHALQDGLAQGSTASFEERNAVRSRLEAHWRGTIAGQQALSHDGMRELLKAILTLVLNGGSALLLEQAQGQLAGADDEVLPQAQIILTGAAHYARGQYREAAKLLLDVDSRAMPPTMAGQMAYVQGLLAASYAPDRAGDFLKDARLLAPGTLVEDAALRKEAALEGASHDEEVRAKERYKGRDGKGDAKDSEDGKGETGETVASFRKAAARYFRRFPRSAQLQEFVTEHAGLFGGGTPDDVSSGLASEDGALTGQFRHIPPAGRGPVFLSLAREALAGGKIRLCYHAARQAMLYLAPDGKDYHAAALHAAASAILVAPEAEARDFFSKVNAAQLSVADRVIFDAAQNLTIHLYKYPDASWRTVRQTGDAGHQSSVRSAGIDSAGRDAMQRSRLALSGVDGLLHGKGNE